MDSIGTKWIQLEKWRDFKKMIIRIMTIFFTFDNSISNEFHIFRIFIGKIVWISSHDVKIIELWRETASNSSR